eukprot:g32363.t1
MAFVLVVLALSVPIAQATHWGVVVPPDAPQARMFPSAVRWEQQVWVFAGAEQNKSNPTPTNDLHCFDTRSPENWHRVTAEDPPPPLQGQSAIVDDLSIMWVWGGYVNSSGSIENLQDVYHIILEDTKCENGNFGKWFQATPENSVPARTQHSAVYLGGTHGGKDGQMVVFGGRTGGVLPSEADTFFADVLYLDLNTFVWTKVDCSNQPPARFGHRAVMGADGRMWVYGGFRLEGKTQMVSLPDLYCLDTVKRTWTLLQLASSPAPLGFHFATMDAAGRMWIGGGIGHISTGANAKVFFLETTAQQLWWEEVEDFKGSPIGLPLDRVAAAAVIEPNGKMWVVGGFRFNHDSDSLCWLDTALEKPTTATTSGGFWATTTKAIIVTTVATTSTSPGPSPSSGDGKLAWIILLLLALASIVGGLLVLRRRRQALLLEERHDPPQDIFQVRTEVTDGLPVEKWNTPVEHSVNEVNEITEVQVKIEDPEPAKDPKEDEVEE